MTAWSSCVSPTFAERVALSPLALPSVLMCGLLEKGDRVKIKADSWDYRMVLPYTLAVIDFGCITPSKI